MCGLRGRGCLGVWHHGGLEYRRTRTCGLVQHSMQRELNGYDSVWMRVKKKTPESRQRKREVEEADKVEVRPEVTVRSLRGVGAAFIGPTQWLLNQRRLHR